MLCIVQHFDSFKLRSRHGIQLVLLDNVYAYILVNDFMTEDAPLNPCNRKGEVRTAIATTLLQSIRRGEAQKIIGRSADFYERVQT
jgi:hypothetical protein